jgi:hypothetical protein
VLYFFLFFVVSIFNSTPKTGSIHNNEVEQTSPRQSGRFEEDTMSTTNNQDTTNPNVVDIDIDPHCPWMSAAVLPVISSGVMLPQKGEKKVPTSGIVWTVDKLTVYFNVADLQDFIDKKITAFIEPDGDYIILNDVVFPRIFHNQLNDFLLAVRPDVQEAEIKAHGYVASNMKKSPALQMKQFRMKLPDGMTVNNSYFNEEFEEKQSLELKIWVCKSKSVAEKKVSGTTKYIKQANYIGYFSVAVDDTKQ